MNPSIGTNIIMFLWCQNTIPELLHMILHLIMSSIHTQHYEKHSIMDQILRHMLGKKWAKYKVFRFILQSSNDNTFFLLPVLCFQARKGLHHLLLFLPINGMNICVFGNLQIHGRWKLLMEILLKFWFGYYLHGFIESNKRNHLKWFPL